MTTRRHREQLMVELLGTQRMLELAGDHPVMSRSLQLKMDRLREELDKIPLDQQDTRVVLLFHGKPVKGSLGIDAGFLGRVTAPFQNMVTAEFAHRVLGKVGARGQLNKQDESRLYLTALPRGSFGVELSKLDSSDLFESQHLADSLTHVTRLIESTTKSDEDFAAELDGTTPRTIQNLKDFFKAIADDQAGVQIETGGIRATLEPETVKRGYERVSGTETQEEEIALNGISKGILLDSWRFDFAIDSGPTITGTIDESLTEDQLEALNNLYFNKPCRAILRKGKVLFKNGRERISYVLLNIEPQ
jgi:hypothetical protein